MATSVDSARSEGSRVTLRPVTKADLPALFEIQLDAGAQTMAAFIDPKASNDLGAYLRKWDGLLGDETIVTRAVIVAGELVGSVGCFEMEGEKEVTYWIRRDWWGRGIATQALAGLLRVVPERPLVGVVAQDNAGSARVLERNGFVRVGEAASFAAARGTEVRELIYRLDDGVAAEG
jgi:RimJ/RimL family protein N-acetyltransferase